MRHILFFLLSIGSVSVLAEPIPPHVGELTFTDYFNYYRSSGNFTNWGTSSSDYPRGGDFSVMSDTLSINFDASPQWRVNANLSGAMVKADNTIDPYTGKGAGLTEGGASAQYWFRRKKWAIVPTVQAAFPFYRNSLTQFDAMIGNGTIWAEGGGWGLLYYHPVTIYGYAGYRYQDSGLSGWFTADLGASYRFDFARARVGFRGETTVTDDRDTSQPFIRNFTLANVNNSSLKYNSINPTVFDAYGEFDWLFSRQWEAGVGFSQSVYGNNAAYGWTVTGMVRFRLPTNAGVRPDPVSQPEYNEGPPISEPIFAPVGVPEDQVAPQPKSNGSHGRKKKSIDQMIKDTERQLQKGE